MVQSGNFSHIDGAPGQLIKPAFLEIGFNELFQRHSLALVGRANATGEGGHRGSVSEAILDNALPDPAYRPRFGVARRSNPVQRPRITAQAITNGVLGCLKIVGMFFSKTKWPKNISA